MQCNAERADVLLPSPDGISPLPIPIAVQSHYSTLCGGAFGLESKAVPLALVCR